MKSALLCAFVFFSNKLFAQSTFLPKTINVFLDCSNGGNCYLDFVKQEIPIVNFVRDRTDADVHVAFKVIYNSSNTAQYELNFIGRNGFSKIQDTLTYSVAPAATDDEARKLLVSHLKVGFMPFLIKTEQASAIQITYLSNDTTNAASVSKDPWKAWVFQLSGNGTMNGNQNYFSGSVYFNISADKETERHKTNFYVNSSEQIDKFKDNGTTYTYEFKNYGAGFQHYHVMSKHLGLGGGLSIANSLFSNYKFQFSGSGNLEYSILPYKEFNSRRWVLLYNVGPTWNQYYDSTIYLKQEELVFQHSVGSIFSYTQPWGAINLGIFWSNYLHDFQKNNLSFNGAVQFKVAKGLNLALWGNYNFVHDQINLRKGDIDLNQLLLKNKELLSSYNFNLGIGLSYRFGSKYNNAINPSFRGLNYSINL